MQRQVEPEWDDDTRALALGLARYEGDTCPGCGLHESILDEPDVYRFTFEERHCAVCTAQDQYGRIVADRDKKHDDQRGEHARPGEKRPSDGRHIFMVPQDPDPTEEA